MAADILNKIIEKKRIDNEKKRELRVQIKTNLDQSEYTRYGLFKQQISKPGKLCLIAEVKKASPSKGIIRDDFDPDALARIYEKTGADAISVLTEEDFFQGKAAYLRMINEKFRTPTLMKDFVVDELQIYEARHCGASAVLLIAAALTDVELSSLMATAHRLDVDTLVEVHDAEEVARAIGLGAEIIGINNRDLHTFDVDISTSERLSKLVPHGTVIVAESGISTHDEIVRLKQAGVNAVLIGETFLREQDVAAKIKEVMGW